MASMKVCLLCGGRYRRSKNREFGTRFCSKRCRWDSRKVPIQIIFRRDDGVCHLCFHTVEPTEASRDHVKPKSKGGKMDFANIKLAHRDCNSRRGSKPVEEFRMMLERQADALRRADIGVTVGGN